ncbi:MAG: class I tRNA ligase family protein [Patescibacteria group bacterium]|nr:class I tRNA ligase family protein [Patescibacteria group bacterium]
MYPFSKIEKKWQKKWFSSGVYEPDLQSAKHPFYTLMMFPYPSAEGLHVGNMYAFTGTDIYGRFKRMQGYDVFEPIGLDGFGIHSENYAIKIGRHPVDQAKTSEKKFYNQLHMIGNGFAWQEHLETYDPEYYRWTQWLFVQMFKKGLAYRKKQAVNWCPSCKTVLAMNRLLPASVNAAAVWW